MEDVNGEEENDEVDNHNYSKGIFRTYTNYVHTSHRTTTNDDSVSVNVIMNTNEETDTKNSNNGGTKDLPNNVNDNGEKQNYQMILKLYQVRNSKVTNSRGNEMKLNQRQKE